MVAEKILFATYELVSVNGYARVSLRDVADKAKVALSQINYYFKNKEGLMAALVQMMADKYIGEIEEILKAGNSSKEKMNSLIKYFKDTLTDNPALLRIFYDLTAMSIWSEKFGKPLNVLFEKLAYLIETHVIKSMEKESRYKSYPPEGMSRMIIGAMIGTALQFMLNPNDDTIDKSLEAIKVVFE